MPAAPVVRLPAKITFEQAAAVILKGLTVQYLFRQTYRLQGNETILVHAAAGGVGLIALPVGESAWREGDRHRVVAGKGGAGEKTPGAWRRSTTARKISSSA